ncbi:MAG: DUF1566 domain-containing protein [Treponema sp.]|jgi:hypothetical protein|nr:DUF1566 domain-containing protein [Treponema sp.]
MKKLLFVCVVVIAALGLTAQTNNLPRLAVVELNTNDTSDRVKKDAVTVRNLVESQMVATGKYQIIAREEIDKLLANQRIQASSISSAENVKKLQLQNISYIVTGSVDAMGNDYAVTVKILDVSTGQFSHSASDFMGSGSRDLYTGVTTLTANFVRGMSSAEGGQVTSTGGGYKIGDTGPGGGIVFAVERNTGMEVSRRLGEYTWNEAIGAAKNYKGGGYGDWRLPSINELNLIYENLQKAGVVNLGRETYWSSSGSSDRAWVQRFSDGYQDGYGKKYTACSVRAVRAF